VRRRGERLGQKRTGDGRKIVFEKSRTSTELRTRVEALRKAVKVAGKERTKPRSLFAVTFKVTHGGDELRKAW